MSRRVTVRLGALSILLLCPLLLAIDIAPPGVWRTFTHHQLTKLDKGVAVTWIPVISDNGSRAVFASWSAEGKPDRISTVAFDGTGVRELDQLADIYFVDLSADGTLALYSNSRELRLARTDGSGVRTIFKPDDGFLSCSRISGDGRVILMVNPRGWRLNDGPDKYRDLVRGVYAISADAMNDARLIAGPAEVAKALGVAETDIGVNFHLYGQVATLDCSYDASRIVFGVAVKDRFVVMGCDGNGANLHRVIESTPRPASGQPTAFVDIYSIALSADGRSLAYAGVNPQELGVIGFDGENRKVLQTPDPKFCFGNDIPIYIAADGSRVCRAGRYFWTDGSWKTELLNSVAGNLLRYSEYPLPAMDANARRFVYWFLIDNRVQLASMELNVPSSERRGAPDLTEIELDPSFITRKNDDGLRTFLRIKPVFASGHKPGAVSGNAFRDGMFDDQITAQVLNDDGKTTGYFHSGDVTAGDGIYTSHSLMASAEAPDGPRALRIDAQSRDADGLLHGFVVEIGAFDLRAGKGEKTSTKITEPPRPPVIDITKGKPESTQTTSSTNTSSTSSTSTTSSNPPKPIDLTGFWQDDKGRAYAIRQIGENVWWSCNALPELRNVFRGTIKDMALSGEWSDLPGGQLNGGGTLTLRIDSADQLTILESRPMNGVVYGARTLTRRANDSTTESTSKPPAEPWETPQGQAAIDAWINDVTKMMNDYKGSDEYNRRKPYGFNQYGLVIGGGISSANPPDNFKEFYRNSKYCYMWNFYTAGPDTWTDPNWRTLRVPRLQDYVTARLNR